MIKLRDILIEISDDDLITQIEQEIIFIKSSFLVPQQKSIRVMIQMNYFTNLLQTKTLSILYLLKLIRDLIGVKNILETLDQK